MATILITGGTGLVGRVLSEVLLEKGYNVIILTRDPDKQKASHSKLSYAKWDVENQIIGNNAIAGADYIIHLAGAGVAEKRWTKKRKQEIIDSRVNSGKLIIETLRNIPNKVKAVVSASAIGWYGPDTVIQNPVPFKEDNKASTGFLGQTCLQWEESIEPVTQLGIRLVKLRIGIVLSKKGGALKEFLKPMRFGLATILGSGKQIISWIHIDDLVNMFVFAIKNEKMIGVYNAVAPNPVSNRELIKQLAKANCRFFVSVKVPSFILKLLLGEMSVEVLKSATVSAEKIIASGFNFRFPEIENAVCDLK